MRARHRTSKLLLRQGIIWSGGAGWSLAHHAWLRRQAFPDRPALQIAYDSAYEAVLLAESRRDRLDRAIAAMAKDSEWAGVVTRLQCLRGISTLTAFALAVEIGDWDRFTGASIGAYLGLVPSEYSSGASRVQGPITKTGNTHARRLLVEAAWQHRRPYRNPSAMMRARWDLAPAAARARGHGQPSSAPAVGELHPAQEEAGGRQHRHRPGTGRLVLVTGDPARLTQGA